MRHLLSALNLLTACTPEPSWSYAEGSPPPPPTACRAGDVALAAGRRFQDLQQAVDTGPPGGSVWLCPGTHIAHGVTLDERVGASRLMGITGDPADVVIDGGRAGDTFEYWADGSYEFSGFTTVNTGRSGDSVAIFQSTHAGDGQLFLRNIISEDHESVSASVDVNGSQLVIEDSEFRDYGSLSAGVVDASMTPFGPTAIRIRRTLFKDIDSPANSQLSVTAGSSHGHHDLIHLEDVEFVDGSLIAVGIGASGPDTTVMLDRVSVSNVDQTLYPRGCASIVNANGSNFRLGARDVSFHDNTARLSAGLCLAGNVPPGGADAHFQDVTFHRNTSQAFGRAALDVANRWRVTLVRTDFGQGPDDNSTDVYGCNQNFGVVSGVVDPARGDFCP